MRTFTESIFKKLPNLHRSRQSNSFHICDMLVSPSDVQYVESCNCCVACGEKIPEGRQICPKCEKGIRK